TAVINATFAVIKETLEKGEKISVNGFGTFEIRERGEKTCINPKTKEKMVCPPCKSPTFRAGRDLKRTINK
ncbi:MAG: HU family DNA-binding protein, partial [Ruminococcus sp.]|nr:HU family DNA-binding protein [Ruminococcus sp.]